MKKSHKEVFQSSFAGFMVIVLSSHVVAAETIIQQEEISYDKCLKVITTSEDKLSIAPEITDAPQKRVAVFTLVDGNTILVME